VNILQVIDDSITYFSYRILLGLLFPMPAFVQAEEYTVRKIDFNLPDGEYTAIALSINVKKLIRHFR